MAAKAKVGKRAASASGKPSKKTNTSTVSAPATTVSESAAAIAHTKTSRKRAADLFDAVESEKIEAQSPEGSRKKAKRAPATPAVSAKTVGSKKPSDAAIATATATATANDFHGFSSDDDAEQDTAALLAGFETSSDSGSEADDGNDKGIPLDKLPRAPITKSALKHSRQITTTTASADSNAQGQQGMTLYIGHIPHGFYELQMRAYFSQFGTIANLRLARNKRTGAPKHYAFIQFESADVADIVARTMDKYLLFGHILQVRRLKEEEVHPQLWRGAGKRFKVVPWTAMQARGMREPREREVWQRRVQRETKRRAKRSKALVEYGYEFAAPHVRGVEDVKERAAAAAAAAVAVAVEGASEANDAAVAEAIEQGTPVPGAVVRANTLANGGAPLAAGAVDAADEVELKQDAESMKLPKGKKKAAAGKRTVSAPLVAAAASTDAGAEDGEEQQQQVKGGRTRQSKAAKGKSSKRVSV